MTLLKRTLLAALLPLLLTSAAKCAEPPAVQSVGQIDLARYIGKWYEIGAFPMYFQRQCVADTTAEYTLQADGRLTVLNRCRTENGFDQATGQAWAPDATINAQLKVSFFWPFRSDYWIIALHPDYRWAVVGNPNRKYLWLLSRTPQLTASEIEHALNQARAQGYDLSQFKLTRQTENGQ